MEFLSLNPIAALGNIPERRGILPYKNEEVKAEFAAIFYGELLKQALSTSSKTFFQDSSQGVFERSFLENDIFIDKVAKELINTKTFSDLIRASIKEEESRQENKW